MNPIRANLGLMFTVVVLWACLLVARAALATGRLELRAVDQRTGEPLAARIHLLNAQGKPFKPRNLRGSFAWGDHIVFDDKLVLDLPNGRYRFVMEHGPEYRVMNGHFDIQNFADDRQTIELTRFCNLASEGWYSGDLDIHRAEVQIERLMRAEDLHVAPLITWTNSRNPWTRKAPPKEVVRRFDDSFFVSVMGGEWDTPGNTLRLFRMHEPIELPSRDDVAGADKKLATALGSLPLIPLVEQARRDHHAWIDAGEPFARDLPIWIALGLVDSVQVLNRSVERDRAATNEAGGWPRDLALFPGPHGNGRWSQEIYYHLLNCGLRIPPTAGSGSGVGPNPVGYNRVYVYVEPTSEGEAPESITWDAWWEGLRAGRVSITNGPLLRTRVEGERPGYVFKTDADKPIELSVALTLSTRDKIRYLEIVKNGRMSISVSLDEFKQAGGQLPPLPFDESGWFVVRAITDVVPTYRYASTGPYYVQVGYQPRISRASVQFFLDWTKKRADEIEQAAAETRSPTVEAAQTAVARAVEYWVALLAKANAD